MADISEEAILLLNMLVEAGHGDLAGRLYDLIESAPSEDEEFGPLATIDGQIESIVSAIEHQAFLPAVLLAESQEKLISMVDGVVGIDASSFSESLASPREIRRQAVRALEAQREFRVALGLPAERAFPRTLR